MAELTQQFLEIRLRGSSITTYELKRKTLAEILEPTQKSLIDVGAKVNPELLLNDKKVKAKGLFTGEFLAYFKKGQMVETPIYEHRLATNRQGQWYETKATQIPFRPNYQRMNNPKPTASPCNAILGILNGQGEIDKNSVIKYNGSPNEEQARGDEYKVSVLINEDEESIANHMNSETFREFTKDRDGVYKITVQGFVEQIYVNHDKSKDENGNLRYQDVDPETGKGCLLYVVLRGVQSSIRKHSDDPRKKEGLKAGWEEGKQALKEHRQRLKASEGISDHIAEREFEEAFPPEKYDQTQAKQSAGDSVGDALSEASQTMKQEQRGSTHQGSKLSEILDENKLYKFSYNNAQRDRALVALATKTQSEEDNKFIRATIEGGYQNLVEEATKLILNANQEVCTAIANTLEDAVEDGELLDDFLEEKKAELPKPEQTGVKEDISSEVLEATGVSDETLDALIAESEGKVQQERKEESNSSSLTLSSYTNKIKEENQTTSESGTQQEFDENGNPIGQTNFVDIGGEDDLFDDEDDD